MRAKPYISFLRCFLRFFLCGFLRCFLRCFLRFFSASMRINAFITCLVHVFFKSLNLRVHAARAAIFAGVQPSRLGYWEDSMLSGGVAPGLRCVRLVQMPGTEDEGAGSVLKYMTKPESDSNAADWPLWHADLLTVQPSRLRSSLRLFLSLTFCLLGFLSLRLLGSSPVITCTAKVS